MSPKQPPAAAKTRAFGPIHDKAVPIYIHERVLDAILDYSEQDATRELGGFLIGGPPDDRAWRVEVREFLPAVDARSRHASLTFTHDTWSALTRQVGANFPGEHIVGWQHTHPNFGVFLSGYDLFIHRNFFRESWQVALVVDPVRREFGFYQWLNDEVVGCGFHRVLGSSA
jgi:proteasome lid subunit RPN8/RPN11